MLPTHVLGGMLLAAPLVRVAPELAPMDSLPGSSAGSSRIWICTSATARPSTSLCTTARSRRSLSSRPWRYRRRRPSAPPCSFGAAVHSVADMYGGGLELRPGGNSDRAVYDHYRGTWIAPRQLVWVRRRSRGPRAVDRAVASPPLPAQRPVSAGRARHARRRRRVHDDPAPSRGACGLDHPLRSGRPVAVPPGPVPRRRSEAVATTTTRRSRIVNVPHNHLADRQRRRSGSIDPRWLTPCLWFVYTDLPSSSGGLLLTGGVQPQNKITYTEVIGSAAFLMQI